MVAENGRPCVHAPDAPSALGPATLNFGGPITSESDVVEVAPNASATLMVTSVVAIVVVVPEITPVLELIERPPGRPVADHV